MNTILYLSEKPSQARQIAAALNATVQNDGAFVGEGVVVIHAFGHMLNLAYPDEYIGFGEWKLDELPILPENWIQNVTPAHKEQFERIGAWLKKVDEVVIATDPDEEGEVIGREILDAHGFNKPVRRLWVSALSKDALHTSLKNVMPLSKTDSMYRAGKTRREIDWLLGMNLSRAYSIKSGKTANVGRIKTRLLQEIVEREKSIRDFKPEAISRAHVEIEGFVYQMAGSGIPSTFVDEGIFVSSRTEPVEIAPPLPFNLSSLLIAANQQAGVGLVEGYAAAQMLYETGAISYPRTGSTSLPGAGGFAVHHAIVATAFDCPSWGGEAERALFGLVRENDVFQQLGAAHGERTETVIDFGGYKFVNTADSLRSDDDAGWLLCKPDVCSRLVGAGKPSIKVGGRVMASPVVENIETEAPGRFTEASLLQKMLDEGIGTESTRVAMISGLWEDGVVEVSDGNLVTTPNGNALFEVIPRDISAQMAAIMNNAVQDARAGSTTGKHQLQATKWLAKLIHS